MSIKTIPEDVETAAAEIDPGESESFSHRAMGGALMLGSAQAVKFACQLASTVILSRLLAPTDFGLFAMLMPLVWFVMMIQDFGLSNAVITVPDVSKSHETTLFLINIGLSVFLAGTLAAASPLIGVFYGTTAVVNLAVVLSGTIVLSGLSTLQFAILTRDLRFGAMTIAEIGGAVGGLLASIIVAIMHPSSWALVASVIGNMSVGLICGWGATRWTPGRPARLSEVKHLLAFGGGIASANISNYIARNADNILIGRYLGAQPLGFYDRAYKLLLFPLMQIVSPLSRTVVPILSRLANDGPRYKAAYRRASNQIMLIAIPGMAVLVVMADELIPLAMGRQWSSVVPIFRWLGLAGMYMPLSQTLPWLLVSQQRTRELSTVMAMHTAVCVIAFVVGLQFQVTGVAASFALTDLFVGLPLMILYVGRSGPISAWDLVKLAAPHVISASLTVIGLLVFRHFVSLPNLPKLIAAGFFGYAIAWTVLALLPGGRETINQFIALVSRATGGRLAWLSVAS
ncbi:lipopolysaccharide biosynthesis protein [Novosphingobium terrae]|uniref:lipopolysaccharide biosynthesis protein n=1 Tax=Novosphingobium terrae TaxID=2726189 RepID=UPI001980F820|nr:lipopolysaccharide biosynthesis protein [Novosphingobium terrae]